MSALAAQLETEGVLLARNRQPIGELRGNRAGFENVRRRLRHRRSGLGDGRFALERNRVAAQIGPARVAPDPKYWPGIRWRVRAPPAPAAWSASTTRHQGLRH